MLPFFLSSPKRNFRIIIYATYTHRDKMNLAVILLPVILCLNLQYVTAHEKTMLTFEKKSVFKRPDKYENSWGKKSELHYLKQI